MLRTRGEQRDALGRDPAAGLRELPEDLRRLDLLLDDPALLEPVRRKWREVTPAAVDNGRPTMPMESYLRQMLIKQRSGWGYKTLRRGVSATVRETRAVARAARIDSTVIEADTRYPTDSGLALDGAAALAREGARLAHASSSGVGVRDRSRTIEPGAVQTGLQAARNPIQKFKRAAPSYLPRRARGRVPAAFTRGR